MKKTAAIVLAMTLYACGGGGEGPLESVAAPTQASEDNPAPSAPVLALSADAPTNNLDLATGAGYSTTQVATSCGYPMPGKVISGVVSSVHDGDTITVDATKVRLEAIDAPELAQTYGAQAKTSLSNLVLGRQVTVHYAKIDKYGRTVGSVFTSTCLYVNLEQVRTGSAWHYKQYQCEQPASTRAAFAAAQADAEDKDRGLWAFVATPPWVYRNGTNPTPPTCSTSDPVWASAPTLTPTTAASAQVSNPCREVWVNGYTRKDGTRVRGHYRTVCA